MYTGHRWTFKEAEVKFYSIEEIAEISKLSQKTIRRQIASNVLEAKRLGNQWRIDEESLHKWINKNSNSNEIPPVQYSLFGESILESKPSKNTRKYTDDVNWTDISEYWMKKKYKTNFTFIDLFAGAGGLSKGLELAGFKGIAAVEFMSAAVETYKHNFDHPVVSDDIKKLETKQSLYNIVNNNNPVDLICGGFPCQGFSLSGYRVVDDSRNTLYRDMLEIVDHIKPKFVLMENVVGLRSMLNGKVEEKIISDYENIGYKINVTTLNAADYHTPQIRKRVIFIGNRINKINYHPNPLLDENDYLTTKNAIGDLIDYPEDENFNHIPAKHSPSMQAKLLAVEEGHSLYKGYSDAWKKCPWNKPSCTIKENHGGVNIHPKLPRVLTAREMARLQSFPDDFIFKGKKSKQLVQIGNAVPPMLGKAVGLAIRKSLEEYNK